MPCRVVYLIHVQGLYRGGLGCPPASPRVPVLPQSRRLISAPALQSAKEAAHDRNCGRPTVHNRRLKRILPQKPSLSRACLKTGEMSDLCPKTRAFKEKTARKACRLSRMFDAESTVLGQNRRRFGVFKQTLRLKDFYANRQVCPRSYILPAVLTCCAAPWGSGSSAARRLPCQSRLSHR